MKKATLVLLAVLLMSKLSLSQDIILLKNGESLRSKITEIGQTEIKYKKFDNQNGPVYVLPKSDISQIYYENGTKDTFSSEQKSIDKPNDAQVPAKVAEKTEKPSLPVTGSKSKFSMGFNVVLPTGTWPATALSNMGTASFLRGQDHPVTSIGFGIMIQMKITKNINLFFDGNAYNYNILIGKQGSDVQTVWTVEEMATHWDEPGAPQIPYVHDLPTDVHFDMQATGFRLGAKYFFLNKKVRPWIGAGFGFYGWQVNYFNDKKDKTYGKDNGFVTGLTYLAGIDFEPMTGIIITPFIDMASPVANYKIEGLFYPQWDIDYNSHIMGTTRFGLTLSFISKTPPKKNR